MAKRLVDTKELLSYTSLGKNKAVSFAKEHGCAIYIGRRVLFDLNKLDEAIDNVQKKEATK
ncbi:MAG: hypothetical protein J5504_11650 [Butyrivibrio sp.]|nr:hypothetical protein [Butyrivibrio sp.]